MQEHLETLKLVANGGVGVALLIVVFWFLNFLRGESKARDKRLLDQAQERKGMREDFTATLDAITDRHREAFREVCDSHKRATDGLQAAIRELNTSIRNGRNGVK